MNTKKLNLILIALMLFSAPLIAGCLGGDDGEEDHTDDDHDDDDDDTNTTTNTTTIPTITIGLLSPQTGPIAFLAPAFESAAEVGIADLNAGTDDYEFELVVADSGCDGTQAGTGAQSLVDAGVAGIVGAACSGATGGAYTVASAAGVPMISYASTAPGLTEGKDLLWRVVPSDDLQADAMADVVAYAGYTSPAVMYINNDYGSGFATFFDTFVDGGACTSISYEEGTTDFSSQVTSLDTAACDAVVLVSYLDDGAAIIEEMATQGVDVGIFGGDGIADAAFDQSFTDNSSLDGVTATKPGSADASDVKTAFEAAYLAANGNESLLGIYTHESYDATMILGAAAMMAEVSAADDAAADMVDMVGTNYNGASGVHTFDANGDVAGNGYLLCEFHDDGEDDVVIVFECPGSWTTSGGLSGDVVGMDYDGMDVTIKIGLLSPQTGPIAFLAPAFESAAQVAIDDLNMMGGPTFELVVADSGCDGTQAGTSAQSLIDAGVVAIVGAACSGATGGAYTVAEAAGIPMISYASTAPGLTEGKDLLWRIVPSDDLQAAAMADVVADAGYSTPAVMYINNDYGSGFATFFDTFVDGGACTSISYEEGTTDFASQVTSVSDAGCDSVVLVSYIDDGAAIIEEMATQGVSIGIFGGDGIADAAFSDAFSDNSSVGGVTATKPGSADDSDAKTYFEAAYLAANGNESLLGIYTHESYDATMILAIAAMEPYSTYADDGVADFIDEIGTDYEGASGIHTFDENGDVAGNGYLVCDFTHDGTDAGFSCDSTWNTVDGLQQNQD